MEKGIKLKIGVAALDALMFKGLPAMVKLVSTLNSQEKITAEDIDALHGELDAENYFDPDVKSSV